MSEQNDGGPAFPRPLSKLSSEEVSSDQEGMSLRDYFAGQAAWQAADVVCDMLADTAESQDTARIEALRHATAAYIVADALLIARAVAK